MGAGGGQQGITVDETIGVNDCGCNTDTTGANTKVSCSLVSSAKNNAAKSHGLHWTVLMMHPSTNFTAVSGQSYTEWLDEFYEKLQALEDYSVHFINFQDLARLQAPGSEAHTSICRLGCSQACMYIGCACVWPRALAL